MIGYTRAPAGITLGRLPVGALTPWLPVGKLTAPCSADPFGPALAKSIAATDADGEIADAIIAAARMRLAADCDGVVLDAVMDAAMATTAAARDGDWLGPVIAAIWPVIAATIAALVAKACMDAVNASAAEANVGLAVGASIATASRSVTAVTAKLLADAVILATFCVVTIADAADGDVADAVMDAVSPRREATEAGLATDASIATESPIVAAVGATLFADAVMLAMFWVLTTADAEDGDVAAAGMTTETSGVDDAAVGLRAAADMAADFDVVPLMIDGDDAAAGMATAATSVVAAGATDCA